ncbi:MAG: TRAP transporter large permease [Pseudomonadota bacterium]|nr:TRAP transporter large permease [Pseudomonadota bacterium]HCH57687.1 C4-dicarboxylate ABC transporter permease [Rhodospirillaceae bacterium]|tara:strand:- start:31 stop:1377 length:1347 start_codon:yes stop_codon:yes gene_type:complete
MEILTEWYSIAGFLVGMIIVLMLLGLPVAFAFLTTNIIGAAIFMGDGTLTGGLDAMPLIVSNAVDSVAIFALIPVPLFIIMGELFFHTGLAVRVFDALDRCFGRLPGRLSYITVAGGTIFATLSGSTMANTAMMGSLMVPEMTKRGYKGHMSMGPILGTGGLAMIIPPSALAVLLASLAEIDIGGLLIAGVIPGLILAVLYSILIFGQVKLDPDAAPEYSVEPSPFKEIIWSLIVNVLPMGFIVFCVIGLIILGVATPTEAAGFGAFGVVILGILFRVMTWDVLVKSFAGALRVTAMVLLIILASTTFSQLLAFTGASAGLIEWATKVDLSPLVVLLIMFGVLLILGMFMDQVSMMLLTVPIFFPLAESFQFDLVWFGLIMLLALEISLTTPPFGLLLFVMVAVAPKGTTLWQVAKAAAPYIGCALIVLVLLIIFPDLALYLPSLMNS